MKQGKNPTKAQKDLIKIAGLNPDNWLIERIRECASCLSRFSTYESINFKECNPYTLKKLHQMTETN